MAVDLADEVRKRKVADDLGFESADYDPIADQDQSARSAPEQNYVLTPVEGMESPIPDFESVEDQPEQGITFPQSTGSDWVSMARPELRDALVRAQQPGSVPSPLPQPSYEASDQTSLAADWLSMAQPEMQAPPPRAELVKLPPTGSVAMASREEAAPAIGAIPVQGPPQPVAMATRELAPPAIQAQPAQPEVRRAELVAQPPTPQAPTVQPPTPQPPTPQAPTPQAPAPQAPGQNYVLTPIDAATGQPFPQPTQPVQPAVQPAVQPSVSAPAEPKLYAQSSGYQQGRNGYQPQFIILHSTDGSSTQADLNTFTDPNGKVGVHYLIGRDGKVYHLASEGDAAKQAGYDKYGNYANDWTIGIEQSHVDRNDAKGIKGEAWTDADIRAAAKTTADIMRRNPQITLDHVLFHSDLAGERKQDPVDYPMQKFYGYVQDELGLPHTPVQKVGYYVPQKGAVGAAPRAPAAGAPPAVQQPLAAQGQYPDLATAAEQNVGVLSTRAMPGTEGGSLGCAGGVCKIIHDEMGIPLRPTLSTSELYDELRDGGWQEVDPHTPGAVIVSPTQGGTHGHTGIVGSDGNSIYSNSSATGNWEQNYTVDGWQQGFANKGLETHAFLPPGGVVVQGAERAPIAQPATKLSNGFYQNEDPKTFLRGPATTFATPEDVASGADPGVGSPKLGKLDTTQVAGVAVPQDVLQSQLGSNPAAWRKARVDVVDPQTGRRLRLPIVDVGPSNPNALFDMTPWVSNYFGGDKTLSVKLVPNAGPDVNKNPGSWADEQASIRQGFDSSALAPGAVKVQKPQNYQLVPVAPSAEGAALQQADQFAQANARASVMDLPESQNGNVIGLYKRLDKPVQGVNDAMRSSIQAGLKPQIIALMRDKYPELRTDAEAWNKALSDVGPLDVGREWFTKALGYAQQFTNVMQKGVAGTDQLHVNQFLDSVLPGASDQQKHDFLSQYYALPQEQKGPFIASHLPQAQAGIPSTDPQQIVSALDRLSDPNFQQQKAQDLAKAKAEMERNVSSDPRLRGTFMEQVVDSTAQLPSFIAAFSNPVLMPAALAQVSDQVREQYRQEHPEWDEKTLSDKAAYATLVQFFGMEAANRIMLKGFGPVVGGIENKAQRAIAQAVFGTGSQAAIAAGTQAATNIIAGDEPGKNVGQAALSGAIQGAVTGGVHGIGELARPERAQPEPRPQPVLPSQVLGPEVSEPEIIPGYSVFQNIPRPPPVTARQILGPEVSTQENVPWYQQRNPLVSRLAEGVWTPESVARAAAGLPEKATPEELMRRALLLQPSPGALREVHLAPEAGAELVPQPTQEKVVQRTASAAQAGVPPVDPRFVTRSSDNTIINVPADEVDQRWNSSPLNKNFYLAPGGEGPNYIGNRYQAAQDYLGGNKPMYAPEVTVASDGSMHFIDGRHTFAAMRDFGLDHVPLAMDAESLKNLQETRIAGIPELQAPVQGEAEPWVSKIANRFSSERVASGELGPITPGQGVSTEEMLARGMKMGPEEINQHVSDLMQDKGNLATQAAAVRAEEARLSQRSNAASRAAEADPTNQQLKTEAENAFNDLTDFHNGPVAKLKNDWHKAGRGMQGEIPVDLSTFNGLREAYLKNLGKAPDPKMEPVLRKTAKAVSDATAAETAAMQKLGAEIEKQARGKTLPTDDQVRARLMEIMKDPCYT